MSKVIAKDAARRAGKPARRAPRVRADSAAGAALRLACAEELARAREMSASALAADKKEMEFMYV
jgi:hypothetical protein